MQQRADDTHREQGEDDGGHHREDVGAPGGCGVDGQGEKDGDEHERGAEDGPAHQ
jgi:hypothetical protein